MSHSQWTDEREDAMRLWIRQLVSLSYLYMRASRVARLANYVITFLSVFGAVYTIPAYGCSLVNGSVCVALQWSGLGIGLVVSVASGLSLAMDPATKSSMYETAGKALLKLSRRISLELQKQPASTRKDAAEFAKKITEKYDYAVDSVRLPWYISGEQQLGNISLLQSYQAATREQRSGGELPRCDLTETDRLVMQNVAYELSRLGGGGVDVA